MQSAKTRICSGPTALFSSSSDVLSHAAQSGADVVITYDPNDTVTLQNVLLDSLRAHPEDILIA